MRPVVLMPNTAAILVPKMLSVAIPIAICNLTVMSVIIGGIKVRIRNFVLCASVVPV